MVLQLLALGETDILAFDFMDPPSEDALVTALEELYLLGAVRGGGGTGEEGGVRLTDLGARMAHFPLEPRLAKAIISAQVRERSHYHQVIASNSIIASLMPTCFIKKVWLLGYRKTCYFHE